MRVNRLPTRLYADPKKVIMRYLGLSGTERLFRIIQKFDGLSEEQIDNGWNAVQNGFVHRHRNYEERLLEHVRRVEKLLQQELPYQGIKRLLFGSYVTLEYTIESAALFNPSIVSHFDQNELPAGSTRFIMSLRAVGEGHISSVEFKIGVIDKDNEVKLEDGDLWRTQASAELMAREEYELHFSTEIPLEERVLFPQSAGESNGMEDLRLVQFDNNGSTEYLGTYTAYNGKEIKSKLLRTTHFEDFKIETLLGEQVLGKGIAIFPRKIRGQFAAIGRQNGATLTMMYAGDDMIWDSTLPLLEPTEPHELVQIGNCGSPIETPEGWLLLTHSVGPMRRYTLGVALLDLEFPERVISFLKKPFMEPLEEEREGYVPNVLYTCGWMKHNDHILIPYAMSDSACGFGTVKISELLEELKER